MKFALCTVPRIKFTDVLRPRCTKNTTRMREGIRVFSFPRVISEDYLNAF
jgi:hypothetical protein